MECPGCGAQNPDNAQYCSLCYRSLAGQAALRNNPLPDDASAPGSGTMISSDMGMDTIIRPGDQCIINRDIMVGDHHAFIRGDPVVVEEVAPKAQRPDNKYVVLSAALQRRFLLTDADLQPAAGVQPMEDIPAKPVGSPGDVFAGQGPEGSPGDVFAGQASEGSPESVFADRIETAEQAGGFRSSRAFRLVIAAVCLFTVIAIIVVAVTMAGGGAKAPQGIPRDWKMYSGKGVQMWLPSGFDVGKSAGDLSRITSKLKEPANTYNEITQSMRRDPSAIVLFALNGGSSDTGKASSVCVTAQEMPEGMGLQDLMDAGVADQAPTLTLSSKQIVTVGGHQMAQMEFNGNIGSKQVAQVAFIVSGGETVFQAVFQCGAQDVDQELPLFRKIIGSIRSS